MLRICITALLVAYASGYSWSSCNLPCDGGMRTDSDYGYTMNCNSFPCVSPIACPCGAFDLLFVLDNSGSIGEFNFWKQKQFVIDLVRGLHMHGGSSASRVGMVGFASAGYDEFTFNDGFDFSDIDALAQRIWDMDYIGGWTNTAAGLSYAKQMLDTQGLGNHKQIVIVITDGYSNKDTHLLAQNAAALHSSGVGVYGIGVGNVNDAELTLISSSPTNKFYYYVNNYSALTTILDDFMNGTCCDFPPPTCQVVSQSACSQTCGGGDISVQEDCTHYDSSGNVLKVESVYLLINCPQVTCLTSCWFDGVEHLAGAVWEEETCADHFIECTCPMSLPAGVTVWDEDDYCHGVCYVASHKYHEGESWNVTGGGVTTECKCETNGEPLCQNLDICRYKRQDHAAGSSWVIDVSGGRRKQCACPAIPPTHAQWTVAKFCTAFCEDAGVMYGPGDTWQATRNGAEFDCRCTNNGVMRCKEIKPDGCRYKHVTHARGASWLQDVSAGRKKECTCPLTGNFRVNRDCSAVCVVGGVTYRPQNNDVFPMDDPSTGLTLDCECNQHGNVKCHNVAADTFQGCHASGQLHPAGQIFILDVSGGRRKECNCPSSMAAGSVWTITQYCRAICVVDGVQYYGGDSFNMTDSCTGDHMSCVCKPYGVVKC